LEVGTLEEAEQVQEVDGPVEGASVMGRTR